MSGANTPQSNVPNSCSRSSNFTLRILRIAQMAHYKVTTKRHSYVLSTFQEALFSCSMYLKGPHVTNKTPGFNKIPNRVKRARYFAALVPSDTDVDPAEEVKDALLPEKREVKTGRLEGAGATSPCLTACQCSRGLPYSDTPGTPVCPTYTQRTGEEGWKLCSCMLAKALMKAYNRLED